MVLKNLQQVFSNLQDTLNTLTENIVFNFTPENPKDINLIRQKISKATDLLLPLTTLDHNDKPLKDSKSGIKKLEIIISQLAKATGETLPTEASQPIQLATQTLSEALTNAKKSLNPQSQDNEEPEP